MRTRPAGEADLPYLGDVERAAGEAFRDVGMPEIADDEPFPPDVLEGYRRAGLAWVVEGTGERAGAPVAYLVAGTVDGNLHVEQVSVHPRYARRRVGRALLDHAAGYAAERGMPALTLTTFADVPWNAPYYLRCGFRVLGEAEITPGLREVVLREAAHGLARWPRVCMRRQV